MRETFIRQADRRPEGSRTIAIVITSAPAMDSTFRLSVMTVPAAPGRY